jgi:hypothetical protein
MLKILIDNKETRLRARWEKTSRGGRKYTEILIYHYHFKTTTFWQLRENNLIEWVEDTNFTHGTPGQWSIWKISARGYDGLTQYNKMIHNRTGKLPG